MQRKPGLMPKKYGFNNMKLWTTLMLVSALLIPTIAESQRAQPRNCVGGTLDAPIRLEVYSDFECSACALFFLDVIIPAVREYGNSGKICVLYNEFPLNGHKYSHKAARYSLAAQRVGRKQWLALMQALYRRQPIWTQDGDIDKALNGVISNEDLVQIKKIANQPVIHDTVNREVTLGVNRKINSTPTVFVTVNNKTQKIDRVLPYEVWKDFIDDKLK
jgi:protein-disulfide isomerase